MSRRGKQRKAARPAARLHDQWLIEFALAWQDAAAAKPFSEALGEAIAEQDFFHLAPMIACKRAGLKPSAAHLREMTRMMLATIVAAQDDPQSRILVVGSPRLLFAYAYINCLLWLERMVIADADDIIDMVLSTERTGELAKIFQLTAVAGVLRCQLPPPATPAAWVEEVCAQWRSSMEGVVMPAAAGSAANTVVPGSLAERTLLCLFRARGLKLSWSLLSKGIKPQRTAITAAETGCADERSGKVPRSLQDFALRYMKWHQSLNLTAEDAIAPVLERLATSWSAALAKADFITSNRRDDHGCK